MRLLLRIIIFLLICQVGYSQVKIPVNQITVSPTISANDIFLIVTNPAVGNGSTRVITLQNLLNSFAFTNFLNTNLPITLHLNITNIIGNGATSFPTYVTNIDGSITLYDINGITQIFNSSNFASSTFVFTLNNNFNIVSNNYTASSNLLSLLNNNFNNVSNNYTISSNTLVLINNNFNVTSNTVINLNNNFLTISNNYVTSSNLLSILNNNYVVSSNTLNIISNNFSVISNNYVGTSNTVSLLNNNFLAVSNNQLRNITTWPGPSSTVIVTNTITGVDYFYLASANCTITAVVGGILGYMNCATLTISNSSASSITVTWSAAGNPMGISTTNVLTLPTGKQGIYSIWERHNLRTNYVNMAEQ